MAQILAYIQIVLSIALMITILLQNRGSGLSAAFGGDFSGFYTKRGIEKFLFVASSILGFFFIANAIIFMLLPN